MKKQFKKIISNDVKIALRELKVSMKCPLKMFLRRF